MRKRNKVAIIGCGTVGKATAKLFKADKCYDNQLTIPEINEIKDYTYIFLCLPTPTTNGIQDQQLIAISDKVIGNFNVLQGEYGTQHPESVAEFEGKVYWFDINSGAVVRATGSEMISTYGVPPTSVQSVFPLIGRELALASSAIHQPSRSKTMLPTTYPMVGSHCP